MRNEYYRTVPITTQRDMAHRWRVSYTDANGCLVAVTHRKLPVALACIRGHIDDDIAAAPGIESK